MYTYNLFKDDKIIYSHPILNNVLDEIKIDLLRHHRFVHETPRGGFKVVAKNGMLFWLKKIAPAHSDATKMDFLAVYQDDDNEEWYRIETARVV